VVGGVTAAVVKDRTAWQVKTDDVVRGMELETRRKLPPVKTTSTNQ